MTFPREVNLYEVGPRDGLQNEKEIIPIDVKVNLKITEDRYFT